MLHLLALLGPISLLLPALLPPLAPAEDAARQRRLATAASLVALGAALLLALGLMLGGRVDGPWLQLDAMTGLLLPLVAAIGAVVVSYSRRYLDGDGGQGRFFRWLGFTLACVLLLVVSGNLVLFGLCWMGASLGLHRLMLFYPGRAAAQLAARKKALASRIGDGCMLGAALLAWHVFDRLDFAGIAALAPAMEQGWATHALAALLVLAALVKSAQFPLHGWLTEVMETPTPVSALLHAGIINAGGILLLRMSGALALSGPAMDGLLLVGAVTAVFGAAVMLTQSSVKVNLAWSTIAQMGFMMMQCGLGAFGAALLHIVAHALYKAHAFLSSGGVVATRRPDPLEPLPLPRLLAALAASLALVLLTGWAFGHGLGDKTGAVLLGAVLMMGLAPMLAACRGRWMTLRAGGLAVAACIAWFALQGAASALLGPVVLPERGWLAPLISLLALGGFAALLVLNARRRSAAPGPRLRALHHHLRQGLYVNALLNRLLAPKGAL
ncbi:MAG TPA: proton-conducting transporter membrane subunit [Roseococcus sp.]|nr:proton-conducting transporter membrane subunit [Roseococcus sp.]